MLAPYLTDLASMIEASVTKKLERLEAKRLGKVKNPRKGLEDADTSPGVREPEPSFALFPERAQETPSCCRAIRNRFQRLNQWKARGSADGDRKPLAF